MVTKLQKWGKGQGLRFSSSILEAARIKVGDEVKVSVRGRQIIVKPVDQTRDRYDLRELVSRMPKDYSVEEVDWGRPVGKEAW